MASVASCKSVGLALANACNAGAEPLSGTKSFADVAHAQPLASGPISLTKGGLTFSAGAGVSATASLDVKPTLGFTAKKSKNLIPNFTANLGGSVTFTLVINLHASASETLSVSHDFPGFPINIGPGFVVPIVGVPFTVQPFIDLPWALSATLAARADATITLQSSAGLVYTYSYINGKSSSSQNSRFQSSAQFSFQETCTLSGTAAITPTLGIGIDLGINLFLLKFEAELFRLTVPVRFDVLSPCQIFHASALLSSCNGQLWWSYSNSRQCYCDARVQCHPRKCMQQQEMVPTRPRHPLDGV